MVKASGANPHRSHVDSRWLDNMRRQSHRHHIARPLSRLFGQSRRWCNAAVAVSLLFQALLPLLHQPQVAANADGIPAWIFASLCRGAAADVATIPADENQQPAPSTAPRCPVCLAAQLASLMLPPPTVAGVTLPIQGEAARFQDATVAPIIAARSLKPAGARATVAGVISALCRGPSGRGITSADASQAA